MPDDHQNNCGKKLLRREDKRLLRGAGTYSADIKPDGVLHIGFARSTMPNARISECDVAGARHMPGVVAVYTAQDIEKLGALAIGGFSLTPVLSVLREVPFPVLAKDNADAVGQPVVAVVAESVYQALDAIDAMYLDFDENQSSNDKRPVFAQNWQHGDVEKVFAGADHIVEVNVQHAKLAPSPMEPRTITVEHHAAENTATIWLSTQTPHRARTEFARVLDIEPERLRVIAPDVGGAFGMKASLYPEEIFSVWAAFNLQRSVKWVATRSEDFLSASHGRGVHSHGELAVSADGQFLGLKAQIEAPLGHWLPTSSAVPAWNAARMLPCGYDIENIDVRTRALTDYRAAVGIYRGAGRPEANCLMERLVDEAARVCNMDPVEIRRKNLLGEDRFPFTTASGNELDSGRYVQALDALCNKVGYSELSDKTAKRREAGEIVGLGIAFYLEPCGNGWESARVTLKADGTVIAATGGSTQGHGRETALAQLVSDELDVSMSRVNIRHGDTNDCPNGIGALASRSTAIGGSAVVKACRQINERRKNGETGVDISEDVVYETEGEAWGYGCYIVSVVIDANTGELCVESASCLDDAGTLINPLLVEGQVLGGFAQGVGEALYEELRYDEFGQLITGSFTDYVMPRADSVPGLDIHKMVTPSPKNLLGAKGVGEAGTIGAPAAILNAAVDALRPFGVKDLQMPLGSEKIWRLIHQIPPRENS